MSGQPGGPEWSCQLRLEHTLCPLVHKASFMCVFMTDTRRKAGEGTKVKHARTTQESHSKPGMEKARTFITGTKLWLGTSWEKDKLSFKGLPRKDTSDSGVREDSSVAWSRNVVMWVGHNYQQERTWRNQESEGGAICSMMLKLSRKLKTKPGGPHCPVQDEKTDNTKAKLNHHVHVLPGRVTPWTWWLPQTLSQVEVHARCPWQQDAKAVLAGTEMQWKAEGGRRKAEEASQIVCPSPRIGNAMFKVL